MKKVNFLKTVSSAAAMVLIFFTLSGCGSFGQQQSQGSTQDISGSVLALGSTALQPLAEEASKLFTAKYPNASIQVQGGGSGNGLTNVSNGSAQIGMSDIFANEKSGIDASALVDHKVCVAGFAAIINPTVTVTNLTKDQLIKIFTGKITNWKDVGGNDTPIIIVNRAAGSGTRATFKKYALDGNEETSGKTLTQDSSGAVVKTVGDTPGAISYVALSYINNPSIKSISIDGAAPTIDNITTGKYPVWSYEHMYTRGEAAGVVKAFIDYMSSGDVEPVIVKLGYIPMSDMKVSR